MVRTTATIFCRRPAQSERLTMGTAAERRGYIGGRILILKSNLRVKSPRPQSDRALVH